MNQKILLATDLSLHSTYILQYAVDFASRLDASVVIVHALEPMNEFANVVVRAYVGINNRDQTQGERIHSIEKAIHERIIDVIADEMLEAGFDLEAVSDVKVLNGRASEVILKQAEILEADMVIVGSHSFHPCGEHEQSLGSVAERVLRNAKVPVFVVPVPDSLTLSVGHLWDCLYRQPPKCQ